MKIRHSVRYAVPLLLCMLGLSHAQPPPIGVPVPALGEGPWVYDVAEEETIRVSVVTRDLSHPWAIAFLPDGGMLITERPGRLRVVRDGVLDPQPISGVPQVRTDGNGGLMDVALHPRFADNRFVYLTYTKPVGDGRGAPALARGRLVEPSAMSGTFSSPTRTRATRVSMAESCSGETARSTCRLGATMGISRKIP